MKMLVEMNSIVSSNDQLDIVFIGNAMVRKIRLLMTHSVSRFDHLNTATQ